MTALGGLCIFWCVTYLLMGHLCTSFHCTFVRWVFALRIPQTTGAVLCIIPSDRRPDV